FQPAGNIAVRPRLWPNMPPINNAGTSGLFSNSVRLAAMQQARPSCCSEKQSYQQNKCQRGVGGWHSYLLSHWGSLDFICAAVLKIPQFSKSLKKITFTPT